MGAIFPQTSAEVFTDHLYVRNGELAVVCDEHLLNRTFAIVPFNMSSPVSGTSSMDRAHERAGAAYAVEFEARVERYKRSKVEDVSDAELLQKIHDAEEADDSSVEFEVETEEQRNQRYMRSELTEVSDPERWMSLHCFEDSDSSDEAATILRFVHLNKTGTKSCCVGALQGIVASEVQVVSQHRYTKKSAIFEATSVPVEKYHHVGCPFVSHGC